MPFRQSPNRGICGAIQRELWLHPSEVLRQEDELSEFFNSVEDDLQCYIAYVLGELTDTQIVQKLKRLGVIKGNTRDPNYRKSVIENMKEVYPIKLQTEIIKAKIDIYFPDLDYAI